jgi:hypothetical protein
MRQLNVSITSSIGVARHCPILECDHATKKQQAVLSNFIHSWKKSALFDTRVTRIGYSLYPYFMW